MTNSIGALGPADELFCHQTTDTFATVATSDPAWTEKVCAMALAADGSLQVGFGLGKYTNRNVMDAYAAISRGIEQVTVRASRRLTPRPDTTVIGPISYEVLEPFRTVRFRLADNDCQPIAFDWTFEAIVPPQLEDRTFNRSGGRVSADLVRYHQTGVASGWVSVDGLRTEIAPERWVATRDHSWGVRYDVGQPALDLEPRQEPPGFSFAMIWCPVAMTRADGSRYALFLHYQITRATGFSQKVVMGGVEHPDGRLERWTDLTPELSFDPANRRLLGGTVHATIGTDERPLHFEVLGATGVHLGAGLYFGWQGHHHGEWRGEEHLEGERIGDCTTPGMARQLHQIRDTAVRVTDPVGGGVGVGNCQPIVVGADPALGLTNEDSFW